MVSRHCNACGNENHPKQRHPSSLKVPSDQPFTRALQSFALTSAQPGDLPAEDPQSSSRQSRSPGMRMVDTAYSIVGNFLRTAWWVLPLPILFSLWRQRKRYEVCRVCGSRDLVPVVAPHGEELPL